MALAPGILVIVLLGAGDRYAFGYAPSEPWQIVIALVSSTIFLSLFGATLRSWAVGRRAVAPPDIIGDH